MVSLASVDWKSLNTLRATPGSGTLVLPASLLAITDAAKLKPAVVRPTMDDLVRQGYVREYQTLHGKQYARTAKGESRIQEIKDWLR